MQDYFNNPQNYIVESGLFWSAHEVAEYATEKEFAILHFVMTNDYHGNNKYAATFIRRKKQELKECSTGTLVTLPNGYKVRPISLTEWGLPVTVDPERKVVTINDEHAALTFLLPSDWRLEIGHPYSNDPTTE